jgi:hypothetical protein
MGKNTNGGSTEAHVAVRGVCGVSGVSDRPRFTPVVIPAPEPGRLSYFVSSTRFQFQQHAEKIKDLKLR